MTFYSGISYEDIDIILLTDIGRKIEEYCPNNDSFKNEMDKMILSAQHYYVGNPDGYFISTDNFDEETVSAPFAYETINTILGNDFAEVTRFNELQMQPIGSKKKMQTPGLITSLGLQKIIDLITLLCICAKNNPTNLKETVRACRSSEIITDSLQIVDALQSTTKGTVDEIVNLGYGNKNDLAICKFHFNPGSVLLDMSIFGNEYIKQEEKEVLLLSGNQYYAKFVGESNKYFGLDGKPAKMYDIEVYCAGNYFINIIEKRKLKEKIFNEKLIQKIKVFYEQLNQLGKYPKEPIGYREWKENFKKYLFSEITYIM